MEAGTLYAMSLPAFFARRPVFTTHEVDAFQTKGVRAGSAPTEQARKSLLQYHRKRGHVLAVRRGLYASVPLGQEAASYAVDPLLVASRMTEDAVLAYHTALEAHGLAHSVLEERACLSENQRVRPFTFQGVHYRAVRPPGALSGKDRMALGVEEQDRAGLTVRVTSLERTLVDVLDRPSLAGGWEEVWRSLDGLDVYLDLDFVVRYALLLQNATTAAKVGYFLDTHRDCLLVEDRHLDTLLRHSPKTPHLAVPASAMKAPRKLVRPWNLRVPVLAGELGGEEPLV